VLVEGIIDADVVEGTIIDFTLSGFDMPYYVNRQMFYYQIGYGSGAIFEGQGEIEGEDDLERYFDWLVYCSPCNLLLDAECDEVNVFYAKKHQVVTYCDLVLGADY